MSIISFEDAWACLRLLPQGNLGVAVITACSSSKMAPKHVNALSWSDIRGAPEHLARRTEELKRYMRAAEDLYSGQHHLRLMRGVRAFRRSGRGALTLKIVSAGFGVVDGATELPPYDESFSMRSSAWINNRAEDLEIPQAANAFLTRRETLKLFCLGDDYYEACAFDWKLHHHSNEHSVVFCSRKYAATVPDMANLHVVLCSQGQASKYKLAMVALKGELGGVLLERLAAEALPKEERKVIDGP